MWDVTVFTKNRDWLLEIAITAKFLRTVLRQPQMKALLSGSDTAGFIAALKELNVTPHVTQNISNHRPVIDGRTIGHSGYAASQWIEEGLRWIKEVALQHRGKDRAGWQFTLAAAASNLTRPAQAGVGVMTKHRHDPNGHSAHAIPRRQTHRFTDRISHLRPDATRSTTTSAPY